MNTPRHARTYSGFLKSNTEIITELFVESKSDNIRSLKCALQDFERVFNCIKQYNFTDQQNTCFLSSFLILEFEYKAGNLKPGQYGFLMLNREFSEKYSNFSEVYVIDSCRRWLLDGEWVQASIDEELSSHFSKMQRLQPEDKILIYQIIDLDDSEFLVGFPKVMKKAYSAELTMDEYIAVLRMQIQARLFDITFPETIDNVKILAAVKLRIERIYSGEIEEPRGAFHDHGR